MQVSTASPTHANKHASQAQRGLARHEKGADKFEDLVGTDEDCDTCDSLSVDVGKDEAWQPEPSPIDPSGDRPLTKPRKQNSEQVQAFLDVNTGEKPRTSFTHSLEALGDRSGDSSVQSEPVDVLGPDSPVGNPGQQPFWMRTALQNTKPVSLNSVRKSVDDGTIDKTIASPTIVTATHETNSPHNDSLPSADLLTKINFQNSPRVRDSNAGIPNQHSKPLNMIAADSRNMIAADSRNMIAADSRISKVVPNVVAYAEQAPVSVYKPSKAMGSNSLGPKQVPSAVVLGKQTPVSAYELGLRNSEELQSVSSRNAALTEDKDVSGDSEKTFGLTQTNEAVNSQSLLPKPSTQTSWSTASESVYQDFTKSAAVSSTLLPNETIDNSGTPIDISNQIEPAVQASKGEQANQNGLFFGGGETADIPQFSDIEVAEFADKLVAQPQIEPTDVFEQIVPRLSGDERTLTIQLEPEELGRLEISVTQDGDQMALLIEVENASTGEFLEKHRQSLVEYLAGQGIDLSSVDFDQLGSKNQGSHSRDHESREESQSKQMVPWENSNTEPDVVDPHSIPGRIHRLV